MTRPMMPVTHRPAAVVSPLMVSRLVTTMVPATMKPRPEMTCALRRVISVGSFSPT